jgi:integrase
MVHRMRNCRLQSDYRDASADEGDFARTGIRHDDELKALLRACRNDAYPFRQYVPLLLATATRRAELAEMRWSEIEGDKWVIPAERAKNGKPHVVPLSTFAQEVLTEVRAFSPVGQ